MSEKNSDAAGGERGVERRGSNGIVSTATAWGNIIGHRIGKAEAVFFSQIILIYIIAICSVINLTNGNGNSSLWISLLSGSKGYLLPNPRMKSRTVVQQSMA